MPFVSRHFRPVWALAFVLCPFISGSPLRRCGRTRRSSQFWQRNYSCSAQPPSWLGWQQLRAQVRPFIFVDFDERYPPFLQLVVTNFGTTMARDAKFLFRPTLESSIDTKDGADGGRVPVRATRMFTEGIPHFAPRNQFTLLFDDVTRRLDRRDLPNFIRRDCHLQGEPVSDALIGELEARCSALLVA